MKKIVLATRNQNKVEELQELLKDLDIRILSATDFPELKEVEEDGDTLEDNALKKAHYVAKITNLPALADDTGLEVDALDGRPGVYSARYAGENVTYQDNVKKLLYELKDVTDLERRNAQFRTVIAFVNDNQEYLFEGGCKGKILDRQRGTEGFGYDPVFQPDGYDQTFAELSMEEKNKISHRGKAVNLFYEWLLSIKDK